MSPELLNKSKRQSADQRRASILEAALPLFSENGFAGTTTKKIADAAGVSEALLYKHFPSKKAIYEGLGEMCCTSSTVLGERIANVPPSTETLIHCVYFMNYVIFIGNPLDKYHTQTVRRLMVFSMLEDGEFAKLFLNSKIVMWMPKLEECLKAAQASGDCVKEPEMNQVRLWLMHHLAVGLGMINNNSIIDYGISKEALLNQSVLFSLRGLGLTEKSIQNHYKPGAILSFINTLVQTEENK